MVRRAERVHREHAEGRRAIDEDDLIFSRGDDWREGFAQASEVVFSLGEFGFDGGEVDFGGDEIELLGGGRDDHVGGLSFAVQDLVEGFAFRLLDAERAGRVGLGVEVDDEGRDAEAREAGAEVHGGGRLADAALLVRDGEDLGHLSVLDGAFDFGRGFVIDAGEAEAEVLHEVGLVAGEVGMRVEGLRRHVRPGVEDGLLNVSRHF